MTVFRLILLLMGSVVLAACGENDRPPEQQKQKTLFIKKMKPKVLTAGQRTELDFPPEVIADVEAASGAAAEPFFEEIEIRSENLKGDVMLSGKRLCGFNVRTRRADEIIENLAASLRSRGFLIFRSEQNYGAVTDIVTVIRGSSSYDILRIQKTEAPNYHLTTKAIIAWLRDQQKLGAFVVTGAGSDWVEARFIRQPRNLRAFAAKVAGFAPDVLREGNGSTEKLADAIGTTNGFRLVWD